MDLVTKSENSEMSLVKETDFTRNSGGVVRTVRYIRIGRSLKIEGYF